MCPDSDWVSSTLNVVCSSRCLSCLSPDFLFVFSLLLVCCCCFFLVFSVLFIPFVFLRVSSVFAFFFLCVSLLHLFCSFSLFPLFPLSLSLGRTLALISSQGFVYLFVLQNHHNYLSKFSKEHYHIDCIYIFIIISFNFFVTMQKYVDTNTFARSIVMLS